MLDEYTFFDSNNNSPPTAFLYSPSLPITRFTISYNINQVEGSNFGDCTVTQNINVTNTNCFTWTWTNCANIGVTIYNTQQSLVQPSSNTICINDPITLEAGNSCGSNVYNWQYSTNATGPFIDLNLQTVGSNSTTGDMSSIIGSYSGNIFFWALINGHNTNIIIYSANPCSPGFLNATTSQATCIYDQVTMTINFERALFTGETIDIFIDKLGPMNTIMTYASATSQAYTGTSFTWPTDLQGAFPADILDGLEVGTYYLDYQVPGAILEPIPPAEIIVIPVSSPIDFTADVTDVNCFNENNGSIEITASGGIGNYQYKLNTNAWVNFNSANSHTISGLGPGTYSVQVRDGNQCEVQQ